MRIMYTIVDCFNNNNMFRAGFLIGAGVAFIISGATSIWFGYYITNKHFI
jgi:hypothetical protein